MSKHDTKVVGDALQNTGIKFVGDENDQHKEQTVEETKEIDMMFPGIEMDRAKANSEVNAMSRAAQLDAIQFGAQEGLPVEDTANRLQDQEAKVVIYNKNPEFEYTKAQATTDPEVNNLEMNIMSNMAYASASLDQAFEAEGEESWWGFGDAALDFADDVARDMTLGAYEAFSGKLEADSKRVIYWAATLSPEEFELQWNGLLEEYKEQGFIRDNNVWGLERLREALFIGGFDAQQGVKQFFAVVDVVDVVGLTALVGKAGRKALVKTPVAKINATAPESASVEYVTNYSQKKAVDPTVDADIGPADMNPHQGYTSRPSSIYDTIRRENQIFQRVDNIMATSNRLYTPSEEAAEVARFRQKLLDDLDSQDFSINAKINYSDYDAPRFVGHIVRPNGKSFETLEGAELVARSIGGTAKAIDPEDARKGFYIEKTTNVKFSEGIEALSDAELNFDKYTEASIRAGGELQERSKWARAFSTVAELPLKATGLSSASSRSVARNSALIDLSDRGLSRVKSGVIDPIIVDFNKLKVEDRSFIDSVITAHRDGDLVQNKRYLSDREFAERYKAANGKEPSEKVLEAYRNMVDMQDWIAIQKATTIMQRYVETGHKKVSIDNNKWSSAGVEVDIGVLKGEDLVYDAKHGLITERKNLDQRALTVFRTVDPYKMTDESAHYIAFADIGELKLEDVMGYNPGGTRVNPHAQYFLGGQAMGDELADVKIILSTYTEKQARSALDEIKVLQQAIRDGNLTDDVVRDNSLWNGGKYQTAEEFREFIDKDWRDFTDVDFAMKARDEDFTFKSTERNEGLYKGLSFGDYAQMHAGRSDRLITHYGGETTRQLSSLEVATTQLQDSLHEMGYRSHNLAAATALVKRVEIEFPQAFKNVTANEGDYITRMFQIEIPQGTKLGRQLEEQRNIILRRLGDKTSISKSFNSFMKEGTEWIFDQVVDPIQQNAVVKKAMKKAGVKNVQSIGDGAKVTGALEGNVLGIAHKMAFFGDVFQTVLQATHAAVIVAVSPKSGFRGSLMAGAMRSMTDPMVAQDVRFIQGARLAESLGIAPEKMDEIYDAFWKWGVDIIDGENLENGAGHTFGRLSVDTPNSELRRAWQNARDKGGKAFNQVKDKGMFFYNAGERSGQRVAFFTALDEYMNLFPTQAVNSPDAMRWITQRANNLNFNMRRTSRSALQANGLAIPLQFMTYAMRSYEAMVIGRGFTGAERARMAGMYTLMGGSIMWGLDETVDSFLSDLGASDEVRKTIKYGLFDELMSVPLEDTGLSPRVSLVGGFVDFFEKITTGQFTEVIGGPSGSIAGPAVGILATLISGQTYSRLADVEVLARSFKGVNNAVAAWGIWQSGILTSRDGVSRFRDLKFSTEEAILKLLGINTLKETEFWDRKNKVWKADKEVQSEIKKYSTVFERAANDYATALASGDPEKIATAKAEFNKIFVYLDVELRGSGYTTSQIIRIKRSVVNPNNPGYAALLEAERKHGWTKQGLR